MKFVIERNALLRALSHVQSVVERRNTIPILSNILIEANHQHLSLWATDMDVEMVEKVSADIDREGSVTTIAQTFYEIVRKIPEGAEIMIGLSEDQLRLIIESGKSNFVLPILPADEFPILSDESLDCQFKISTIDLQRLIDKTKFAISQEETRYYLNGIYFHIYQGKLRSVATDGHRLALAEMNCPAGADKMPGVIISRKTVSELVRLLSDFPEAEVKIAVSDSKIRFQIDHIILTSKLIEGNFPEYNRVIPTNNNKEMQVEKTLFSQAVERVSTVSIEKTRSIKLSLEKGKLELAVRHPESGQATEEINVEYDSDSMKLGFNSRYLLDVADKINGEKIRVLFSDETSPGLIKDTGDEDVLYVLMPLRG